MCDENWMLVLASCVSLEKLQNQGMDKLISEDVSIHLMSMGRFQPV